MNKLNFGLDAPKITARLFIAAAIVLILFLLSIIVDKSYTIIKVLIFLLIFCLFIITGFLMVFSSKIFKIKNRDKIIGDLNLTGSETVLDIGCGRGLYAIGFAEKLTNGKVFGIDIWNAEDISMNAESSVMENIRKANLEQKIILKTEDMRHMSFDNEYFDYIIASFSIHNLANIDEIKKSLREISRVLKKNGKLIIIDFKYIKDYKNYLLNNNFKIFKESFAKGLFPIAKNLIFIKK